MEHKLDLSKLLEHIPPSHLSYQEWVNIGMALKHEGYTASDWDLWSQADARYDAGECFRKWDTFQGSGSPVTGATITQMAKDYGWQSASSESREIGWNDTISDGYIVVDTDWVEGKEIIPPVDFNPVNEITRYLETLFEASDLVGIVTDSWYNEQKEKYFPTQGACDRSAGRLIEELNKCDGDIGKVLGDYKEDAGAWIRFNPLDGQGGKNVNVTDYRYALVESDHISLEKQNAILRELELPIACLVHSGKKSLHAIVKVEAADEKEYRKRVDYLYEICKKNGLIVDTQNKNPSRLSRMPGVTRNGEKQFLIDTNIGKHSWTEWYEWIESVNDDLPEPEGLEEHWDNLPPLAPVLIDGILRQGHKMLMAGPSKAGKSFALIELSIAIAEGVKWLDWQCTQGKVLYVNLELDRASCLHRFKDVYTALGLAPNNLKNIDIWNLRGKTAPMDKLTPKLIRRALKKGYIAIIIDPIYKVLTGDENSADQMAHFTGQFDKICTELGAATIYCHHHSKGSQSGKKSMDRASGSGVFARDPDALIDLVELEVDENIMKHQVNKVVAKYCESELKKHNQQYLEDKVSQDDLCSSSEMESHMTSAKVKSNASEVRQSAHNMTAWRVEGTLREFPKFKPINMWFNYPIHDVDDSDILKNIKLDDEITGFEKMQEANKVKAELAKKAFKEAVESANYGEPSTIKMLADYLEITDQAVRKKLKNNKIFYLEDGVVKAKNNDVITTEQIQPTT